MGFKIEKQEEVMGVHQTEGMKDVSRIKEHEADCKTFIYKNLPLFIDTSNDVDQLLHKIARINPTLGFDWVDTFVSYLPKFQKEWKELYSERNHYNPDTHQRDIPANGQRTKWNAISEPYWQRRYDLFCMYGHDNTYDILFEERLTIKYKGWDSIKEVTK